MIDLLIVGPNGKMGRALVRNAVQNPDLRLVGGVGPQGRDYIGVDLGLLVGLGERVGAEVYDDIECIIPECEVVLECTRPQVSMQILEACRAYGKAFVTGTTGFSDEQIRVIEEVSRNIPLLRASNASPIVHLLYDLVRIVARRVGAQADVDIIEMHGSTKLDAPSGTALELGTMMARELGVELEEAARYGGRGEGSRAPDTIGFSSIRSGGVPSTHSVIFGFENERLELSHHAYNMDAFADGMIEAVLFIAEQPVGQYCLEDALADLPPDS
jgi:4-hydroxy-tetrahydrodipicolinate reductase